MADFDGILKASIGGSSFQLMQYSSKNEPIVKEGQGQIGNRITIVGEGEVTADTATALATALADAADKMTISGQNVTITGLGGVTEIALLAAQCVDHGPHVGIELLREGNSPGVKAVRFTAVGVTAGKSSGQSTPANFKVQTTTRPDQTATIVYSADAIGPGAADQVNNITIPALLAQYKDTQWTRNVTSTTNDAGDRVTWSVAFTQLLQPLPGGSAVDGEVTTRVTRDEKYRLLFDYSYDLLIEGSADAVINAIRPAGVILHETYSTTAIKQVRLQATFTTLGGADGNALMDWDATIEIQTEEAPVKARTYPGAAPVLYRDEVPVFRVIYRGSAVGAGAFPTPPATIIPTLEELPRVTFVHVNEVEKRTEWEHRYLLTAGLHVPGSDEGTILAALARPTSPQFLGGGLD